MSLELFAERRYDFCYEADLRITQRTEPESIHGVHQYYEGI